MYPRIRELREDNDFNQTTVAKVLNMSQTGYSKYETGENDISPEILIKLSFFYNTSIEYLLGTSNDKNLPVVSGDRLESYNTCRNLFLKLTEKKHL